MVGCNVFLRVFHTHKDIPEYAAAFFLLGDSLADAINVCVRQLDDFQLAVALTRVVEQGDDGPVLKHLLSNTVLPIAFAGGNRWLAGWAFWLLRRRDLAVRVLVVSTPSTFSRTLLDFFVCAYLVTPRRYRRGA